MLNQSEKATLAVMGVPKDRLGEEIELDRLLDSLREEHQDRVKSGINGDFYVYPKTTSMYTVKSVNDGTVENTYTVNLRSHSSCSCYDYLMRCTSSGMFCKHIWRTRFLIKLGCLPSDSEDPFSWMISELYKDRQWIEDKNGSEETIEELYELEQRITKQGRSVVDYEQVMDERARMMMGAMFSSDL